MRNAFVRRTSRLFLGCTLVAAGTLPALANAAWQPDKNVEIVVTGTTGDEHLGEACCQHALPSSLRVRPGPGFGVLDPGAGSHAEGFRAPGRGR